MKSFKVFHPEWSIELIKKMGRLELLDYAKAQEVDLRDAEVDNGLTTQNLRDYLIKQIEHDNR